MLTFFVTDPGLEGHQLLSLVCSELALSRELIPMVCCSSFSVGNLVLLFECSLLDTMGGLLELMLRMQR